MEEIAKEYKVDWVNTDIGLGVPMTAPGIYTDESGNLFLNNRYSSAHSDARMLYIVGDCFNSLSIVILLIFLAVDYSHYCE